MSGVTISRRAVAMWQCLCPFPCWKSRGYRADGVLLKSSAKVHVELCLSETYTPRVDGGQMNLWIWS